MDEAELDAYCAELVADPDMLKRHAARMDALKVYLTCEVADIPAAREALLAVA